MVADIDFCDAHGHLKDDCPYCEADAQIAGIQARHCIETAILDATIAELRLALADARKRERERCVAVIRNLHLMDSHLENWIIRELEHE